MSDTTNNVRVRWWMQDTEESGHWEVSGAMSIERADKIANGGHYSNAQVVRDEDGWPPFHNTFSDGADA